MPPPVTGPCGGKGQPACPPENAALPGIPKYTLADMSKYGWECYLKGREDEKKGVPVDEEFEQAKESGFVG